MCVVERVRGLWGRRFRKKAQIGSPLAIEGRRVEKERQEER